MSLSEQKKNYAKQILMEMRNLSEEEAESAVNEMSDEEYEDLKDKYRKMKEQQGTGQTVHMKESGAIAEEYQENKQEESNGLTDHQRLLLDLTKEFNTVEQALCRSADDEGLTVNLESLNYIDYETAKALHAIATQYAQGDTQKAKAMAIEYGLVQFTVSGDQSTEDASGTEKEDSGKGKDKKSAKKQKKRDKKTVIHTFKVLTGQRIIRRVFTNLGETCARLRNDPEQQEKDIQRAIDALREMQRLSQKSEDRKEAKRKAVEAVEARYDAEEEGEKDISKMKEEAAEAVEKKYEGGEEDGENQDSEPQDKAS